MLTQKPFGKTIYPMTIYPGRSVPKNHPFFSYCERRRDVLLKHVDEGNKKAWWLYLKPEVKPKCEISWL